MRAKQRLTSACEAFAVKNGELNIRSDHYAMWHNVANSQEQVKLFNSVHYENYDRDNGNPRGDHRDDAEGAAQTTRSAAVF